MADDLTGAAELGAVGLRHCLEAEVVIGGKCESGADLICVDTDSRGCAPGEAARRAVAAALSLRDSGAGWIYKKVDSVLRGQVLAEIRGIQKALGMRAVLLVPANPGLGRVIRHGHYYVKGKLIHQTDFARDPEFPRNSSKVLKMLGPSAKRGVTVSRPERPWSASGVILGEVSSAADLRRWAAQRGPDILLAGGAEFFGALLNATHSTRTTSRPSISATARKSPADRRELFVCGSTSDSTRRFVNEAARNGTPVFSLLRAELKRFSLGASALQSIAEEAIRAFRFHPRVVLAIGRPLIERRAVARKLAKCIAEVAALVLAASKPNHLFAEGGATAAELVRHLGWERMSVVRELAPGVTTLALLDRKSPLLTIKPGSYQGWTKLG